MKTFIVETNSGAPYIKVRAESKEAAIQAAKISGMDGHLTALELEIVSAGHSDDDGHQSALELKHEERMLGSLHYSDQEFPRF